MTEQIKTPFAKYYLSKEEISNILNIAICDSKLISKEDTAVIFYDLSFIENRIRLIKNIFPGTTLHAVAIKANPLIKIMELLNNLNVGIEAASLPELYLAERVGFPPDRIVYDSPVKTKKEIEFALKQGVHLNADSFDELDRIDEILKTVDSTSTIGIRVNPQVGAGNIKSTSVADSISKFGIPLNDNSDKLKEYFLNHSWLTGIHVHIGSQGCPVPLLMNGIGKVLNFAKEVNESLQNIDLNRKLNIFDIGGGLPVSYYPDRKPISIEEYLNMLKENLPELFSGEFKLITEFGRYIFANSGWVASKVEYVKREKNYNIIMTHIGADLLTRECYNPEDWHHEFTILDKNGNLKSGKDTNKYIVAGPLCFAGDVIAKNLELPEVEEGDYVLVHDIGAYTLSSWSRFNSRTIPKVIAYNSNFEFEIIKNREDMEQIYDFWS